MKQIWVTPLCMLHEHFYLLDKNQITIDFLLGTGCFMDAMKIIFSTEIFFHVLNIRIVL